MHGKWGSNTPCSWHSMILYMACHVKLREGLSAYVLDLKCMLVHSEQISVRKVRAYCCKVLWGVDVRGPFIKFCKWLRTLVRTHAGGNDAGIEKKYVLPLKRCQTLYKEHLPWSVTTHSMRPSPFHWTNFISKHFGVWVIKDVNHCKYTHLYNRFIHCCL